MTTDYLQYKNLLSNLPYDQPIKAQIRGHGSAGSAVENLHNLKVNNRSGSDLTYTELKCDNIGLSSSMVSLSGKNPNYWYSDGEMIKKKGLNPKIWKDYSYYDSEKGKNQLFATITFNKPCIIKKENEHNSFLITREKDFYHISVNDNVVGGWLETELSDHFKKKMKSVAYYRCDPIDDHHYSVIDVSFLTGLRSFEDLFENQVISLDLRMSQNSRGTCRDRGSMFRVRNITDLYSDNIPMIENKKWVAS